MDFYSSPNFGTSAKPPRRSEPGAQRRASSAGSRRRPAARRTSDRIDGGQAALAAKPPGSP